ncbi:MAG: GDP-L-fucose synthase, partial [Desulfobacteraceae bacterium]|nr:GDP-L-fucose synthase [Desulfobacteraceae bacterium]
KIFVVGDRSIVGSALIQHFESNGFNDIISESVCGLDLMDQGSVRRFFKTERPEYVFLTHLKSGGIIANTKYPAEFIYNNLQIQNNVIHHAYEYGAKKLLFLGSSCVFPRECPQPMKEEYFLSGRLEKTSESYAVAKIAGIKMCQSYNQQYGVKYMSLIPATIYGPRDDFDLETGHVIPSLIRRFHQAKVENKETVTIWGTGRPRREFLYVEDVVNAVIFLMDNYDESEVINVGGGLDVPIREVSQLIKDTVGYRGEIVFDPAKPDGAPQKLLDNNKAIKLGWKATVSLEEGIRRTYKWYREKEQ